MYTFLLLAIPVAVAFFCLTQKRYAWHSFVPPAVFGLFLASVLCVIKKFLLFFTYIQTTNMFLNFFFLFITEMLVPLVASNIIFLIFARDSGLYKCAAQVPLLGAFLAVSMPFTVLNSIDRYSPFMLFGKPLFAIGTVVFFATFLHYAVLTKRGALKPLFAVLAVLSLGLCALAETVWYYTNLDVFFICAGLMCATLAFFLNSIVQKHAQTTSLY